LFLAEKLQNQVFPNVKFFHHPLLLEKNGRKLSKSNQSAGLKGLYEKKESPRKVFQLAAGLLGIHNEGISTLEDLKEGIIEAGILTGGPQSSWG
ncbi:MAG: tRNA glutamyl-Q synthetase, partial [Bacteroidetes bacterium]|nr:tRNA glutamyl-Q synthetase [Bacteroidota bacterium]